MSEARPPVQGEVFRIPAPGGEVVGDLLAPSGSGPWPAVLMAPGFGGTRDVGLPPFARAFQEAGFVVALFDYRHFGESGGEPRQLLSIRRQIEDWHTALAYLRSRAEVLADSVALWGTSFSGGHVIRVGAEDGEVAAVVSQIPFTSGIRTALRLPLLSSLKVLLAAAGDVSRSMIGARPVWMPIVGPPGSLAAMALDEAVRGYRELHEGSDWNNRVCARIGPATLAYRPLRWARRLTCPLLVQVGARDGLTPPGPARAMAHRARRGHFLSYDSDHFQVYFGALRDEVIREQVRFLRDHLEPADP